MDERGQATIPWLVLIVAFIGVVTLVGVKAGGVFTERCQAQNAADAAALAGVIKGESAARSAAEKNQGLLHMYQTIGDDVLVEVGVGGQSARARASVRSASLK